MKNCHSQLRGLRALLFPFCLLTLAAIPLAGQGLPPDSNPDPLGNAGERRDKVETGAGYTPHNGNAIRAVTDLHVPGAVGENGLDFTRYWNSTGGGGPFASGGWSHSWNWNAWGEWVAPETCEGCSLATGYYLIHVGYPDGSTAEFSFSYSFSGADPGWPPLPANWTSEGGKYLGDHLGGMDPEGAQFYLHLADGSSVHFESGGSGYQATEVIDPHGLSTHLEHEPDLLRVTGPDGRSLRIIAGYLPNYSAPVVQAVESGSGASLQRVEYDYTSYTAGGQDFYALTQVRYLGDLGTDGLPIRANYFYTPWVGPVPHEPRTMKGPVQTQANDPRFAGAMSHIRYILRGGPGGTPFCPPQNWPNPAPPTNGGPYLRVAAYPVEKELSGDTLAMVSELSIPCNGVLETGKRTETRGAGGKRKFYYGKAGGLDPVTGAMPASNGFELAKLTDFAVDPTAANVPRDFHNYSKHHLWRAFDACGTLTEYTYQNSYVYNPPELDSSSQIQEIWYRGSDNSKRTFDWMTTDGWDLLDTTRMHNPYKQWLFSKTDELGRTTEYTRDGLRRVKGIKHPDESTEAFTYNNFNQVTSHTLPSGAVETYEYDGTGRLLREYNSVDGYDARKEYTYDAFDRVATMTDGRARANGAPYSVMMEYNGRHQTTKVHYPATGGASDPTVIYEYDDRGNCTAITNELGYTTTYAYDAYRRCTSMTEPLNAPDWNGTGNSASRTWSWVYDRTLPPNYTDVVDASTHTSNKWRIQVEPAFNAAGDRRVTARNYDYNDYLVTEQTGGVLPAGQTVLSGNWSFTGPDVETHSYTYDANGNKVSYTDPLSRITTYEYDFRNRLKKTNETVNTVPRTTTIVSDFAGNKTKVTFPDTKTQEWLNFDGFGQPSQCKDERLNTTDLTYQWGPMKKLATVTTHRDKDGGGTENQVTTFSYDLTGRPTSTLFPDGSDEVTTYEFGQVKTFQTRKDAKKTFSYDARGRETSHTWDDGVTPGISRSWDDANRLAALWNIFSSIDYGYDDAGQVIFEGNDIAGSGGRTQTNYYRYPDGGVAHLHYPGGVWLRNDYTARGQLDSTGWDDDDGNWWYRLAHYFYLPDGKVDHVDRDNGTASVFGYDGRGFMNAVAHKRTDNGAVFAGRSYTRDTRDRITVAQKGNNSSANPMENGRGDRFVYDAEGQLTDAWYNALDAGGSFSSERLLRQKKALAGPQLNTINGWEREDHFVYDQLGNRKGQNTLATRGVVSFSRRDNGLNQYLSWNPPQAGINYETNGDLTQEGYINASFNALNQPISISSPSVVPAGSLVWFGYDPLGRCVKRWVSDLGDPYTNPATYFHYDGWNLLQEGGNAWGPERVYMHGNRVDEIVASYNTWTGEFAFHHYDARGHCITLTDRWANILEQYEYDAFGKPYFYDSTAQPLNSSTFGNRFLFTGREWLKEVGVYDFRNRHYLPELGRFLQPDPKQFEAGDYNLYRYCHNDPVNRSDPFGLADKVYEGAEGYWERNYNPTDRIVMVAHGSAKGGAVTVDANGKVTGRISASTIAQDAIKAGYSESKNKVELSICESGVGGKNSLAQKVANELEARTGVKPDVSAPDGETANPASMGNRTGKITSGPLTATPDAAKGHSGKILHFTPEPKNKKKDK